jgi:hypothetical protein
MTIILDQGLVLQEIAGSCVGCAPPGYGQISAVLNIIVLLVINNDR